MRILHLSTPTDWRGGEQQVAHLMNGLLNEVAQQFLITPFDSALQKKTPSSISCIGFHRKRSINLSLARLIKKSCKEHQIDIIHAHD